jgi:hypothetical protein
MDARNSKKKTGQIIKRNGVKNMNPNTCATKNIVIRAKQTM